MARSSSSLDLDGVLSGRGGPEPGSAVAEPAQDARRRIVRIGVERRRDLRGHAVDAPAGAPGARHPALEGGHTTAVTVAVGVGVPVAFAVRVLAAPPAAATVALREGLV